MVTIKDIAKQAGVSVSTASRALNDNPRISKETREKIKKIAVAAGYQPNYTARNLTRGVSNMVGLIFPVTEDTAPANPFHIDLMRGVSSALQPLHYEMVVAIAPTQEELLEEVRSMVDQSKVHNFLVFYAMKNDPITAYLRKNDLNFVIIGHPTDHHPDRFVDNDNVAAGKIATEQLLKTHQLSHPAFLESTNPWMFERERSKGYEECMQEQGLKGIVWQLETNADSLDNFLEEYSETDGLLFSDDLLFVRFSNELQRRSLPVFCFNNSRLMGMLTNSDGRIDLQPRELGREAVRLLFNPKKQHSYIAFKIN
ncbi:LacI family DNA-binding transcriptional regulator [Limosilactobacillus agrestimuris]|uniref:LacI family DNA-binding transcriptional regulator n=1 Tax=Limosilactobacillus agrestimuris TaxID=2941331 RepID=UPI0020410A92|nr:LacI family DNA-binding transcriptional regulator [Limosilactobacillus agrestimuris]